MLKGIDVTLYAAQVVGTDEFNADIYEETPEVVHNVIVAPITATDVIAVNQLYGKKAVYQLYIPKGDAHEWEDKRVTFTVGGISFDGRVFGATNAYQDSMVPLEWNKQAWVEQYG